jgi:deltex
LCDFLSLQYHEHPGARFCGTERTAFLPNTPDGCRLLTRLKYAFKHGLTFTVGTSLTTGRSDVVTWTSIPHKTSFNGASGDPHGFPDGKYLSNCNSALDALGVPSADDCLIRPQVVAID